MAGLRGLTDDRLVAVYVRKSKATETGKSIEIQKEKCIALAFSHLDASRDEVLIYEDDGKSGFYADRPQYRRLLRDIEQNRIKAVICYKIDRISRRTLDLLNLVQQMEQKGIAFISVSDHDINTSTRTGKIMISLLAAIAEFERDIIAERITDNMYELAKEGRWLGGECPTGYFSKKERLTINGRRKTVNRLEAVEEEQRIVKRLFRLYLSAGSLAATAAGLNREGFKTKRNGDFSPIAVKTILQNPVYASADRDILEYFKSLNVSVWADEQDFDGTRGIMAYNKTEQTREVSAESGALSPKYTNKSVRRDIKEWIIAVGMHKGVISGSDWIEAQRLLAEKSHSCAARPKNVSKALLSGLIRCPGCGSGMVVRPESGRYNADGTPRYRYVCGARYRKKGGCDYSINIKGQEIDRFVLREICGAAMLKDTFYNELAGMRGMLAHKSFEAGRELQALKRRLAQIELELQNQTNNLRTAPEGIRLVIYDDIVSLCEERADVQGRASQIDADMRGRHVSRADIERVGRILADYQSLIKSAGYEAKIRFLRMVLDCVIVNGDDVQIFLKGSKPRISSN